MKNKSKSKSKYQEQTKSYRGMYDFKGIGSTNHENSKMKIWRNEKASSLFVARDERIFYYLDKWLRLNIITWYNS